ncbi:MAG: energy transducer TonB [Candidatus Obscuribacterales bacterium]|nr:energy transducer TonB [Steroidobacteraceae bacterium]
MNTHVAYTPLMAQPLEVATASPLRKGGLFVLVVFAHALAAYGLTRSPPQVEVTAVQPLQVTILQESHRESEQPLPPPRPLQQPNIVLLTEPVLLNIAEPDTTSTTVAALTAETATTSAALGAPKVVSSVEYIREPQPKYPPVARALKQRGTVTLRVLVDAAGHAREVSLHRTSGYRLLDDAARTAVLNALFKPYTESGQSLPVYVFIPIEFGAA